MTLRILPVAISLLLLALCLPAAEAATTCTPTSPARACVGTGPCYGVGATTGATDFYPGAAVCKTPAQGGAYFCGTASAGFASFGGFYGPQASLCVLGDNTPLVLCAGPGSGFFDPVCL